MAKKRMFNLGVLETDSFMDMPLSAQALYFHLNLRADDDGFIGNPKRIAKVIGANEDDLKLLIAKRFILAFEDGVIVIKHWRMHNAIRKDRYTRTNFYDDLATLKLKPNGSYTFDENFPEINELEPFKIGDNDSDKEDDIPDGNQMATIGMTDDDIRLSSGCQTSASVLGIGIDKYIDKDINSTTKEQDDCDDLPMIPLVDGTEWKIPHDYYQECLNCYPDIDVKKEFVSMRMWSLSNPAKKKTKAGIKRFINNWLSKANKKGTEYKIEPPKKAQVSERLKGYE